MPLFITSKSQAVQHGVYAIEKTPPATIRATGTSLSIIVAQFPWGPDGIETKPGTFKDLVNMIAPAGMAHTGSGYLSVIAKGWPAGMLGFVRVVGPTAAKAQIALQTFVTVIGKYKGTAGNSIVATVSNASDGDTNHFDLKVEVTGASGTSTDTIRNLNYSGTGADSVPDFTNTILIGAITKQASGRPANNTYALAGGTDGTVTATEYVGTAGTGDKGIALLEGDTAVSAVFSDDPGNTLRAAVNAGLVAHAALMGDRVVYINGNSGLTQAATQTDAALYRSSNVVYVDPWVRIYDETAAKVLVPPSSFAAALAASTSPSTCICWKNVEQTSKLAGIVELETDRGAGAGSNTLQGIATIIKEPTGGFSLEAAPVTIAASDTAKGHLTRTRMGHYIARSLVSSTRSVVDAPNVEVNQEDQVTAVDRFLASLKAERKRDPNHNPFIVDYKITPITQSNTQYEIDSGDLNVDLDVKIGSSIERLFFNIRFGETVTISSLG